MEPARRIELRLPPDQGGVLSLPLGRRGPEQAKAVLCVAPDRRLFQHSWPGRTRTCVANPWSSEIRTRTRGPCLASAGTRCAMNDPSPSRSPANQASSTSDILRICILSLYNLHTSLYRAAVRCRTEPLALRRRGRSRARRHSWPPWSRTRKFRGQGPAGLPIPSVAIEYERRDSNRHCADFGAYLCQLELRPRAPPGSRTPFPGLRVRCITSHACGAQRRRRESNPRDQGGSPAPKPFGHFSVDPAGTDPASALFRRPLIHLS